MSAPAVGAPHGEVDRPSGSREARPVGFVSGLRTHGTRTAVITDDGELTYRELADRVDEVARRLGTERRLVMIEASNDLATLVGYLGALRGGHVALLAARGDRAQRSDLVERFAPDAVIGADERIRWAHSQPGHELHPDLALLMTTSGSTGRPRLVRLAASSLDANAAAIAEYLDIEPTDRAATTLPMHYCYGLSIVHSNLLRGAALVLTDRSVTDPRFWDRVRASRVTSLHGVPYTFELLEHVGFESMRLPHLRYVTQAGGRMAAEQVRRWARAGRNGGWRLHVMYGQTEATARMAYLPPELAETAADAIGRPIPGGEITIDPLGSDGVGEIVYRGPNVMLGYAHDPSDLAAGRTVHQLRTGDLGRRRADGLYEIVGRRSRFIKPFGVRIDLDGLEQLLADHDLRTACTGTDDGLMVAVEGTGQEDRARALVEERLGLPAHAITIATVTELPRRPNGKLDHPAVADLAATARKPAVDTAGGVLRRWWPRRRRPASVREVFARTFPARELRDDRSFVDLGGDSLTYVQVAGDIERALGRLVPGWDRIPLGELAALSPRRSRFATLESAIVLRALAIVFVVGDHTHLWNLVGGAHLLLAISGWTFARFVLVDRDDPAPTTSRNRHSGLPARILRSMLRIAVPSSLWILSRAVEHNVRFVDVLLVGSLVPPIVRGYWFVDVLVQILLVLAVLFAIPGIRQLDRRYPFGFPAAVLVITLVGRLFPLGYADWFNVDFYSTQVVAWLFVLGWLIQRVRTRSQGWIVAAVVLSLVPSFFGADVERSLIVTVGALVLLLVPHISLPRALARVLTALASASLAIYLIHFALLPLGGVGVPAAVLVPLALSAGIAAWWVATEAGRRFALWRAAPRGPGRIGDRLRPDRVNRDAMVA